MLVSDDKYRVLKEYFGYVGFRNGQEEVIDSICSGRDVVCVMPTGAGKSLCYQVPAMLFSGLTIVISPLISLMQDQVKSLVQSGIRAAYINSTLTPGQYRDVLRMMREGICKIVYISPERLENKSFLEFVETLDISMIAVDEAHCISHWGQDFRPSYLKISEFSERLKKRPIMAGFTATATEKVKNDIKNLLKLNDPFSLTTGFDRPNLFFSVIQPPTRTEKLLELVNERYSLSGIVYCLTRSNVDKVCDILNENGFHAVKYHGGMPDHEKKKNQEDFIYDRVPVMVATNAFGMGIDKSNVSYVIHFNMPMDLESYYQEAGRAGRDGSEAECIIMYNRSDLRILRMFINNIDENPDLTDEMKNDLREAHELRLKFMTFYCTTSDCLRGFILRYFGERKNCRCGKCSNCVSKYEWTDITVEAQKILSCAARTRQVCDINMLCDILLGVNNDTVLRSGYDKLSTYGIMSDSTRDKIRAVINVLIIRKYVNITEDPVPVLLLNKLSAEILKGRQKVTSKLLSDKTFVVNNGSNTEDEENFDEKLMEFLKALRKKLASKASVPAYVIFSDAVLREICRKKPKNRSEFSGISGVGAVKLDRYGDIFIKAIKEYRGET